MTLRIRIAVILIHLPIVGLAQAASPYFGIEVLDDQTNRGVPLVELTTPSHMRFVTDSAGLVAINDPALMDHKIFFSLSSYGYEYPKDGFGARGIALDVKPGEIKTLKIKRTNIAERLYRITGEGIYADSVMLGRTPPIKHPLINAEVTGQDSVLAPIYHGQIHYFWGDTAKQSYVLGHFKMSGAVADLPERGGLDPSVGIDLTYFIGPNGFSREMAPLPDKGCVWIDEPLVLKDESGKERMIAYGSLVEGLAKRLGRFLVIYNDEKDAFEKLKPVDEDAPLAPNGHSFRYTTGGTEYFYFAYPYPCIRVPATWKAVQDLKQYEGFTPLQPGKRYDKKSPPLERDGAGKLIFAWKKETPPLTSAQLNEIVEGGFAKRVELPHRMADATTGKPILVHGASVYFNDYRRKWIMLFVQIFGESMLGEVWYAESDNIEGPWDKAVKVATHDRAVSDEHGARREKMDFYNPCHHPFYDQQGGRIIYFEGTYTNTFSGNPAPTPRYEYNQLMYRLDLSDPRLKPAQQQPQQ
jgi:hypothetical protein